MNLDPTDIERLPVVKVTIKSLVLSGSPRRLGENWNHVRTLALAEARELAPILIHRSSMRVIDGILRLLAARMRGDSEIEARFFEGDDASSYVLAVSVDPATRGSTTQQGDTCRDGDETETTGTFLAKGTPDRAGQL